MIDVEVMSLNEKEDHGQNTRMHMYVCVCMHVCGCVCACVQVCLCACVRVEHTVDRRVRHMSLSEKEDHSAYTCVCACVCVCVGVCHGVGACISVCVCACVCVQSLTCVHTRTHALLCLSEISSSTIHLSYKVALVVFICVKWLIHMYDADQT